MASEQPNNVKEYYRLVTEVDIGLVARELLAGRIVQESPRLLQCDCPNHKSQSHRSLHVMLDKQDGTASGAAWAEMCCSWWNSSVSES